MVFDINLHRPAYGGLLKTKPILGDRTLSSAAAFSNLDAFPATGGGFILFDGS